VVGVKEHFIGTQLESYLPVHWSKGEEFRRRPSIPVIKQVCEMSQK